MRSTDLICVLEPPALIMPTIILIRVGASARNTADHAVLISQAFHNEAIPIKTWQCCKSHTAGPNTLYSAVLAYGGL